MLPGEPLAITVCALNEGVDAVCAEAAPRTTARMMARKTNLLGVLDQLNTAFGAKAVGKIAEIGVTHLQVPPQAGLALLEHLRQRPDVEFAEFDSEVQAFLQPDDPYYSTMFASSHYGNVDQWGPVAVSAPAAWDVTLG